MRRKQEQACVSEQTATLIGGDGPVWAHPHVQELKKFTQSFGKDSMIPLERVSTTLEDVRRNSESLMLSAHSTIQRFAQDGSRSPVTTIEPLKKIRVNANNNKNKKKKMNVETRVVEDEGRASPKKKGGNIVTASRRKNYGMRRAISDTSISSGRDTFEWLPNLGGRWNPGSSEDDSPMSFQLLQSELHQKARLVHSRSAQQFEKMAASLMNKPKEALSTAQQTLNNCQQNLQLLHVSLQQSFSEGRAVMETRLQALGEPGSPFSSRERLQELLSHDEGKDDGQRRPWGPFQKQAHKRRYLKSQPRVESSLKEDGRQITIVTTASLPWMTGTAVNPLLRAAYLARDGSKSVNLMVPWLAKSDQKRIFPNGMTFDSPEEQETWVKDWLKKRTGFAPDFTLTFYPGRYAPEKCSILPVGDPTKYVPESAADVAILEEPEHLTWYHHGRRWTDKFSHVVGVVHTNYLDYARREDGGSSKEMLLKHINSWVTRIHCHKVVKLSDAVQDLPRQTTEFVHGVAESFLKVGEKKANAPRDGSPRFSKGAYFLGKCVWAKGYTELIDLLSENKEKLGDGVSVDCYGTGEDLQDVKSESEKRKLGLQFLGARDHLDDSIHDYQVFVNPSMSDVVATTSAEALAMGKWVVCADHPSNVFFSQFQNCLIYRNADEFVEHMKFALSHEPAPMTPEDRNRLTWEAATERFLNVTELTEKDLTPDPLTATIDSAAWLTHNSLCGIEPLRAAAGAGKNTRDNPKNLAAYEPHESGGGLFDRTL